VIAVYNVFVAFISAKNEKNTDVVVLGIQHAFATVLLYFYNHTCIIQLSIYVTTCAKLVRKGSLLTRSFVPPHSSSFARRLRAIIYALAASRAAHSASAVSSNAATVA